MEVASLLGRVGLPAPIAELAARDWDAVVVGGGHNGLTAAAYLARAGQSVLVEGLSSISAAPPPTRRAR
jgi:heterodisulfide reductase subunit A-like polyferredoxin